MVEHLAMDPLSGPAPPQETSHLTAPFSKSPAYTTDFSHSLDIPLSAMSGSGTKKSASQTFFFTRLTATECQAHLARGGRRPSSSSKSKEPKEAQPAATSQGWAWHAMAVRRVKKKV